MIKSRVLHLSEKMFHLFCKSLGLDVVALLEHDEGDGGENRHKLLVVVWSLFIAAEHVGLVMRMMVMMVIMVMMVMMVVMVMLVMVMMASVIMMIMMMIQL